MSISILRSWIEALERGGTIAATARWCLEAFAGEHPTVVVATHDARIHG